ncbi:MAG: hypothetical protein R2699_16535 [Acidimicrobiales bacterium]
MGSAADLRFVALALADDGAVPAGPRPSAVLAVPTDVGGDTVHKPEGTLQTTDDGPCGEPSALRAVEPQVYASSFLEDAETSTAQRVLVFTDDDEALDYAAAFGVLGLPVARRAHVDGGRGARRQHRARRPDRRPRRHHHHHRGHRRRSVRLRRRRAQRQVAASAWLPLPSPPPAPMRCWR